MSMCKFILISYDFHVRPKEILLFDITIAGWSLQIIFDEKHSLASPVILARCEYSLSSVSNKT